MGNSNTAVIRMIDIHCTPNIENMEATLGEGSPEPVTYIEGLQI